MFTATHVRVEPTDRIEALPDGQVRITTATGSVTLELADSGTAHRLGDALYDTRDSLALRKAHRLAVLNGEIR